MGDVPPTLVSIQLATPDNPYASNTASYIVTFSKPVTGVDVSNFQPNLQFGAAAGSMSVTPLSSSVYKVTLSGMTGSGNASLTFFDNGHVVDLAGNPIQPGRLAAFGPGTVSSSLVGNVAVGDVNGDGKPDMVSNF